MINEQNVIRTRKFLRQIQKHSSHLEKIFQSVDDDNYRKNLRNEIEDIIGVELSLSYLYSDSYSANSVLNEEAISNVQTLTDAGIFLLTEESISKKLGKSIIDLTNIIGFLFDRHTFSYYVNQDKLKKFVDTLLILDSDKENKSKNIFTNPLCLYKILYERTLEVEGLIETPNREYSNILPLLPEIRKRTKNRYRENIMYLESQFEYEDISIENETIYCKISEYQSIAAKVYHSSPNNSEKNIGGFVALYDTNLEFEKLESNLERVKIRKMDELHFEKITENNALINLALNDEVTILNIKIIN
ncbi:MAG: hypothetical protein LBL58_08410 [Tannerellaceae bacterium]|nr:hypothetical protein [Tannerellaceae bacterium]